MEVNYHTIFGESAQEGKPFEATLADVMYMIIKDSCAFARAFGT